MERISGHSIDPEKIDSLKPITLNLRFYIDSFRAQLISKELWQYGREYLRNHLKQQLPDGSSRKLFDEFTSSNSPEAWADAIAYVLSMIELSIISKLEKRYKKDGKIVFPNALLVNQSNPINVDIGNGNFNILDILYPKDEIDGVPEHYIDASCDGIIFAPGKMDREAEYKKLKGRVGSPGTELEFAL